VGLRGPISKGTGEEGEGRKGHIDVKNVQKCKRKTLKEVKKT